MDEEVGVVEHEGCFDWAYFGGCGSGLGESCDAGDHWWFVLAHEFADEAIVCS